MADHHKAQNVKQTNDAAHQRRGVEPVHQEWIGLQPVELTTLQRAVANPGRARPADILNLQRAVGNRAVSRLLGSAALRRPRPVIQPFVGPALSEVEGPRVQAKLTVGPAGDHYEREADRVADQVMTMPAPVSSQPSVQRQAEEEEEVQTKPLAATITPLVQRQAEEEEEEIQTKPLVQRQAEEEELQTKQLLQRQPEEEEEVQTRPLFQRQAEEEEEEIQTKPLVQRQAEEEEELQMKPLVQRQEEEKEIQTKPLVQRQADGSFEARSELESRLATYKGSGSPLPNGVRAYMEPRFGADFSGVRVHTGSEAAGLNRSLSAQAFTHSQDIYLGAGRYDPGTTAGKRLLAHELTHVVQQQPGVVQKTADPSATAVTNRNGNRNAAVLQRVEVREHARATIQRNYAALGPMAKARVDQQGEEKYADKALEFEFKMAPKIMNDTLANQAVDVLLTRMRTIVDAWATSTGRELGQTYEREFGWAGGDVYYGAFEMTADAIRQVFEDRSQPMRKKLKLVYNAVRNNNLSKWLKLAAIELDRKARGETPRDWKIKTATQGVVKERDNATGQIKSFVKGRAEKEIVKAGFAERSGMEGWLTPEQITSFAGTAATEKKTEHSRSKRDVFGHDVMSSIMGWKPATHKAHGERKGSTAGKLPRSEQRTLTVGDVPDLTVAEINQLYKKQGKPIPDAAERARFQSDPAAKIEWEQGGETMDVILGSESARAAAEVKARMEAGISGSTDLMLHAMENLGLGSSPELMKAMRLALAGWMLANRDHSFYEVYKASESYGVPFVNPKTDPGFMYEATDNLYPMKKEDFHDTLPENVFPRHFLSTTYKDTLATSLPEAAKDQNAFRASLRAQGVPDSILNTLDARATVELARLSEVVAAQPIDRLEHMTKKLYAVRQIKHHSSFIYLGNTLGEDQANALLNALLKTHHGGKGLAPDTGSGKNTLADAGVPDAILNGLTPKQMTALGAVRQAVTRARVDPNTGVPDMTQIDKALRKLKTGKQDRDKIKEILVETYHGASPDKRRLAEIERIAQMQRTSGTWFSWGHLGYLNGFANAADIKDYALSAVRSPQGYGLYVSDKIFGSTKYGETLGYGVVVARLINVPTIGKANAAQRAAIQALQYKDRQMQFEDLYQDDNYIGMLMVYQGEFGAFKWARLTTSAGVTVTTDLSTVDAAELLGLYNQIPDGKPAKNNMKIQAQKCGVDVSTWS